MVEIERKQLAFDIGTCSTPEQAVVDLASYATEHGELPLWERIWPFEMYLLADGDLYNPVFGRLSDNLCWKTEKRCIESKAALEMCQMVAAHDSGFIVWISPPYLNSPKPEARFVVWDIASKGGVRVIDGRGIPGYQDEKKCLRIANRMRHFCPDDLEEFKTVKKLRSTPMFFPNLSSLEFSWTYFLQEMADDQPAEVWETIRNGDDMARKEKLLQKAEKVIAKTDLKVARRVAIEKRILIGAVIEHEMQKMGVVFQTSGSCGFSNQFLLEEKGVLTKFSQKAESKKGVYAKECPYCGQKIGKVIHPGYHCPGCGREYTGICG